MNRCCALLICASLSGAVLATERSPSEVVVQFYEPFIHPDGRHAGWPAYRSVESLLGKELGRALRAQHEYEEVCRALTPRDIKPHIIDQNIFLGPDGAQRLVGTPQEIHGQYARVEAQLGLGDDYTWQDTVLLRRDGDRWLVVEILFMDGHSLTEVLLDFAQVRACAL